MVVKLETVTAMYADVYPALPKSRRDMECMTSDCPRRQKPRCTALPALVEDDSEIEAYTPEPKSYILHTELRRQKSLSPQRRERMRRQLALPSLSEDEEP